MKKYKWKNVSVSGIGVRWSGDIADVVKIKEWLRPHQVAFWPLTKSDEALATKHRMEIHYFRSADDYSKEKYTLLKCNPGDWIFKKNPRLEKIIVVNHSAVCMLVSLDPVRVTDHLGYKIYPGVEP